MDFRDGYYYEYNMYLKIGFSLVCMLGYIIYLFDDVMKEKFGCELCDGVISFDFDVEFEVESYLNYMGEVFFKNFDVNIYLLMICVLDYFDLVEDYNYELSKVLV